jgi:hypothetical protein
MSPGTGLLDEKPIAVEEVLVELALPAGYSAASARALTPEEAEPREVKLEAADGRIRLRVPKFLVYSVVRLDLKRAP